MMHASAREEALREPACLDMTTEKPRLDFQDILWLRRAATKAGAAQVPPEIADKLIGAGLAEVGVKPPTLRITEKGRIALTKLG